MFSEITISFIFLLVAVNSLMFLNFQDGSMIFVILINISIVTFFIYILRKISPLEIAVKKVADISRDFLELPNTKENNKEFTQNELNLLATKIESLQESRKIFLRNIMHELKTPIAKGKISSDLLEPSTNRDRIKRAFSRLEYIIGEFAKIERVISGTHELDIRRYSAVELVKNSIDLLMLEDREIDIELNDEVYLDVDFECISIALKHILEYALKSGENRVKVLIKKDRIAILSHSYKLENFPLEKIESKKHQNISDIVELGLYTAKKIIEKHNFKIEYEQIEGVNIFEIAFVALLAKERE